MTVKTVEYTPLLQRTVDCGAQTIVHVGGAGSSKSHTLAQLLILKLGSESNKRIGICRKTFPALRMTAMDLIIGLLDEYGMYEQGSHNKSENKYSYNGNTIQFFSMGVHEEQKERIKSTNFNYIWMEEGNEFTYDDYMYLRLRLRNPTVPGEPNRMFLSLNPTDGNGWIPQKLVPQGSVEVIHSTYRDNPFLDKQYIRDLENLINEDANYYRVYTLGEWGVLENLIYPNYEVVPEMPVEYQAMAYGLDFGYTHPTALTKVVQNERDVYLDERIYQTHLTNSDVIEKLSHEERGDIYADSAEPDRIEEIFRAGYNIYPAMKDVQLGIDLCRRQTLHITERSVNILKEIRAYQRKVDKDGNVMEEPVKFRDDAMDSMRYCVYGMTDRFGFATAAPNDRKWQTSKPGYRF